MSRFNDLFEKDLDEFHDVLTQIRNYQRKQASLNWNFWRGVFYGLGFFVGSALLTTLFLYALTHLGVDNSSIIGKFIQSVIDLFSRAKG